MTKPRLRRWPWILGVALLLVASVLAWQFRPLSPSEKRLVGVWGSRVSLSPPADQVSFTADHRFEWQTDRLTSTGRWSFDGRRLTISFDISSTEPPLRRIFRTLLNDRRSVPFSVTFRADGGLTMSYPTGGEIQWFRRPDDR